MTSDDKMNKVFAEATALLHMVEPFGSVTAQEYKRVLSLAKQYRKWCNECLDGAMIDSYIRVPRLKTEFKLRHDNIKKRLDNGEFDRAEVSIAYWKKNHPAPPLPEDSSPPSRKAPLFQKTYDDDSFLEFVDDVLKGVGDTTGKTLKFTIEEVDDSLIP